VSRAWRDLAEDDHLWCSIAHGLGYDESTLTAEKQEWKQQVKDHILQERQLQSNWKVSNHDLTYFNIQKTLVIAKLMG
jgi:hypothetical protein